MIRLRIYLNVEQKRKDYFALSSYFNKYISHKKTLIDRNLEI